MKKSKLLSLLSVFIFSFILLFVSSCSHEHTWDEGIITKQATCTENGEKIYNCTHNKCEEIKIQTINAKGHTEVVDEAVEPTCTTGLTEGKHCSVCNEVLVAQEIIEAQHTYVNGSCEMCGATEGLKYSLAGEGYSVAVGEARDKVNIVIPSYYNNLPVTSIGDFAFESCSSLESITIPKSVTSIGEGAFSDCVSLESIIIPESTTNIGGHAFERCTSLINITIPDSVTSIGEYAFFWCRSLTSIVIPKSVTSIGGSAFLACDSLTSITLPFYSTHFGHIFGASSYHYNPSVVPSSLKEVTITGGISISYGAFFGCNHLESIIIPESITSIGDHAFEMCSSLINITIPDSVTSIGFGAFAGCVSLESIIIPESITRIGDHAFERCNSLINITIPDSITSIGDHAFESCVSLTSITIPDSVISIDNSAFDQCRALTTVYYTGTEEQWDNINIENGNTSLINATIIYNYVEN